jgi:NADH:ubiquinone oxidoreductase subunit 2 (subunit N)
MVLLIAAAINTVIALTYYLRIPSLMIFGKQTIPAHPIPQSVWVHLLAFALGIPLILLGIWKFDSLWGFLWDMQ